MDVIYLYGIFDKKSGYYDNPYFAVTDIYAKRRYLLMMEEKQSPLKLFKDEFELHKVGSFDIQTGKVEQFSEVLLEGKQLP